MKSYDELMVELKKATDQKQKEEIIIQIKALKAYEDAYKYNAKEMELLS
jgi:hypothetical protein